MVRLSEVVVSQRSASSFPVSIPHVGAAGLPASTARARQDSNNPARIFGRKSTTGTSPVYSQYS